MRITNGRRGNSLLSQARLVFRFVYQRCKLPVHARVNEFLFLQIMIPS